MGKRNLNKYKRKKKNLNDDEESKNKNEEKEIIDFQLDNIDSLVSNLNSNNYEIKEKITNFLSSIEFDDNLKNKYENIFTNKNFIINLISLLNDKFYQIKYNSISVLINLIINFSDNNNIFFLNTIFTETKFVNYSIDIIQNFYLVEDKISKEHIKRVKTLKNLLDLFMLIVDIYEKEINNYFNEILFELIFLITEKKFFCNDEILIKVNKVLANIFSIKIININDIEFIKKNILLKNYLEMAFQFMNYKYEDKKDEKFFTNELLKNLYNFNLFYFSCCNNDYFLEKNINLYEQLIDYFYNKIINEKCLINIENFNKELLNEINNNDNNDKMNIEGEKKLNNHKINDEIKLKAKNLEKEIDCLLYSLRIFHDIINSLDLYTNYNNNENNNNIFNEEEYEELNDSNNYIEEEKDKYEIIINNSIKNILSQNNFFPLKNLLNSNFFNSLFKYCELRNKISKYFINDFDILIIIQDNLIEIENLSLSLINNIINKFSNFFENNFIEILYNFLIKNLEFYFKLKNIDSFEKLNLYILIFRTILEKFKLNLNISNEFLNNLITLIQYSKDSFLQCNIIDIINFLLCYQNSYSFSKNLKDLIFNNNINNNLEVLSHVLNAFMDIFKNDDYESNKYLKELDIINLFNNNLNEFKNRIKKEKNPEKETYDYIKETYINMKRFVKYKLDSFQKLNL